MICKYTTDLSSLTTLGLSLTCRAPFLQAYRSYIIYFFHPLLPFCCQERSSYLEYQKVVRELEHLSRLTVAFQFAEAEVCSMWHTVLVFPPLCSLAAEVGMMV